MPKISFLIYSSPISSGIPSDTSIKWWEVIKMGFPSHSPLQHIQFTGVVKKFLLGFSHKLLWKKSSTQYLQVSTNKGITHSFLHLNQLDLLCSTKIYPPLEIQF